MTSVKKLKKSIRNIKRVFQHRADIDRIKADIQKKFGDVEFKLASFGGADMNFYVLRNSVKFAMLRLAIEDKKDDALPISRFDKEKRLANEYKAYRKGFQDDLTPEVLYYSKDALMCEYLNGERVFNLLKKDRSKVWDILISAMQIYQKLHALSIVHLDATLKNFVMDDGRMKVIDFEYYAGIPEFDIEEQKAYDYVRIIEHTLRTIPGEYQGNYHQFIKDLDKIVPSEIRDVDFNHVKPWIKNIQTYPIYPDLKEKIFPKLSF